MSHEMVNRIHEEKMGCPVTLKPKVEVDVLDIPFHSAVAEPPQVGDKRALDHDCSSHEVQKILKINLYVVGHPCKDVWYRVR